MKIRSREEELWWCAPWLWRRREVILNSLERGEDWCQSKNPKHNHPSFSLYEGGEGLSPIGDLLPYLFFAPDGWTLGDWRYLDHNKEFFQLSQPWRFGWVDSLRSQAQNACPLPLSTGALEQTLSPVDKCLWVMPDPRRLDIETIEETDDTKRVCKLLQACLENFISEDPHIASLWIENGELLCGWEPMPPRDTRCINNTSNWYSDDPKPRVDKAGKRILRWGWQWGENTYPGATDDRGLEARRAQRIKETAEVFTPMPLAQKMVSGMSADAKTGWTSTWLDNSCGDGNFLVAMLSELSKYQHANHILDHRIYGIDLQEDNVKRARLRLGLTPDRPAWQHVRCGDALAYDYSFIPKDDSRLTRR